MISQMEQSYMGGNSDTTSSPTNTTIEVKLILSIDHY